MDFKFCISEETGLFHAYFGDDKIEELEKFGIHGWSIHDQVFIDAMQRIIESLRPCMSKCYRYQLE